MEDMFDNVVLCRECGKKMQKVFFDKNGFKLRALQCMSCGKRIIHPADVEELKRFSELKHRAFHVKLRMVGNSYAVSIPHEIIDFMKESNDVHERMKKNMEKMVTLAFEEMGKLSLMFAENNQSEKEPEKRKIEEKFISKKNLEEKD